MPHLAHFRPHKTDLQYQHRASTTRTSGNLTPKYRRRNQSSTKHASNHFLGDCLETTKSPPALAMSSRFVSTGAIDVETGDAVPVTAQPPPSASTNNKSADEWAAVQAQLETERQAREAKRKAEMQGERGKSLFEVLEANKAAKQAAFEEAWVPPSLWFSTPFFSVPLAFFLGLAPWSVEEERVHAWLTRCG